MNELIAAAKAVIEDWNSSMPHDGVSEEAEDALRAAVERAESQEAVGFEEWWTKQNLWDWYVSKRDSAEMAWTAAQQAERERIRARVKLAAISSWSASQVYIGPPFIQLQKFVDRLLEDGDA